MNKKTDFIIIGAAILDILAQPAGPDVFTTGSYPAEHITMKTGGDAMNEAAVLSSLGSSVRLITNLGKISTNKYRFFITKAKAYTLAFINYSLTNTFSISAIYIV